MIKTFALVLAAILLQGWSAHADNNLEMAKRKPWIYGPGPGPGYGGFGSPPPHSHRRLPPIPHHRHHRHHHGPGFSFGLYPYFYPYPYFQTFRLWYCSARGENWRGGHRTFYSGGYASLQRAQREAYAICRNRGYRDCRVACWSR